MAVENFRVLLGDLPVGTLNRTSSGHVEFRLLASYKAAYPRPTLGQQFVDDLDAIHRARGRVPAWFANLLPEGALRTLISQQVGVRPEQELVLLRHLGGDLPGAVRIEHEQAELVLRIDEPGPVSAREAPDSDWHFSLAGVQLKFSARAQGQGLTIPAGGIDGDWIVKLPDDRYADVPRNEFATMLWARESGIEVPETRLVALADITGLPRLPEGRREDMAFAVRRFDRPGDGQRVHIEDFAQVFGLYPEQKYEHRNYETIANFVLAVAGEPDFAELIRRYVFMVASGNGDAHLKNWSLSYPGGMRARLSPAYDLVSTIQYLPDDRLALNFARSKAWADVSLDGFRRMARKLDIDESRLIEMVQAAVERVRAAWSAGCGHFGYPQAAVERLERHIATVPLLR